MNFKERFFCKSHVPNCLTFLNLAFSVAALMEILPGRYGNAGLFILAAGIVDRYDGRIARLIDAESLIGRELDSLADNVSFGVAPAILLYQQFQLSQIPVLGTLIPILYCISSTFRLARYNSSEFDGYFTGIPVTVAGPALVVVALFMKNQGIAPAPPMLLLMLLFAWLMSSQLRFRKQ